MMQYQELALLMCETIQLMREVDGVVESAGGWAIK
jgi:hypothetical protein